MLNFPIPYPDELLYSTIARAGIRHGLISPKQLLEEVFDGNRKVIATLDLPNHLNPLIKQLPSRFGIEQLAYQHTLFPLYAPFIPEQRRVQCLQWILNPCSTTPAIFPCHNPEIFPIFSSVLYYPGTFSCC